jgi:hypothetical protein
LCLTHFGLFRGNLAWHWDDLEKRLVDWGQLVREDLAQGKDEAQIQTHLQSSAAGEFQRLGVDPSAYDVAVSYESLVSGYVRYWKKQTEVTK